MNAPASTAMAPAIAINPITVSISEALRLSGLGRTRLYELVMNGDIKSRKLGKRRLVDYASLKHYLTNEEEGKAP
jgi:excisionase family DNA binding protein